MKKQWLVLVMVVPLLALGSMAPAQPVAAQEGGPIELEGLLHGAAFKIRVPENWNGVLLLYAHGYTTQPVTDPEIAFLGDAAQTALLSEGYALAASGFRGTGFNVEEGLWDTKELLSTFEKEVGRPEHVILYGISMGGVVTLKSIEKYPNLYSAALPLCTLGAGTAASFDHKLDYALAYDVAFGWPESWGTVGDVRDDIEFYGDVWFAKVYGEIFDGGGFNWANYPRWEFIRRVTGTSLGGYYSYSGPVAMPPAVVTMALFMTQQRAELEVRAGGAISQNVGQVYSLSPEDQAFLEGMGVPVEAWLAEMNARAVYEADPNARNYLKHYADYSGKIQVPVLMGHTIEDSICDVSNTTAYLETVQAEGNEDSLVRAYSTLPGHCNFTVPQMLTLFDATVGWLESGVPPTEEAFPAALDFAPGYSPEP